MKSGIDHLKLRIYGFFSKLNKRKNFLRFARIIELIPVMLPVIIVCFGISSISLLLAGRLYSILFWAIGIILSFIASIIIYKSYNIDRPGSRLEQNLFDLLAVVGILVWALINMYYSSQNIYSYRDPGVYGITAAWVQRNDTLNIPRSDVYGDQIEDSKINLKTSSAGFGGSLVEKDTLYAQGQHLFPSLLGVTGRFIGDNWMYRLNAVFGGIALLSVYAVARLFVKPRWAFVSIIIFGATLPLIYFSRDTYSEPLAAAITFGALALLWAAEKSKDLKIWLISGITAGGIVLSRVDGYLTIAAIVLYFIIRLGTVDARDRLNKTKCVLTYGIGALSVGLLGYFDLTRLSSGYYVGLNHKVQHEIFIIFLLIVLGALGVAITWNTKIIKFIDVHSRKWRSKAIIFFVIFIGLFFASRPLWLQVQRTGLSKPSEVIMQFQKNAGQEINGKRNYYEQSFNWVIWYIGPAMAGFGVIGMSVIASKVLKDRKYIKYLPTLLVVATTAVVYLYRPSIDPDQIWASRRFLPVVMPGLIIFSIFIYEKLWDLNFYNPKVRRGMVTVLVILSIGTPLFISMPYLKIRTFNPQLAQIKELCNNLPNDSVVILGGTLRLVGVQTVNTFCEVPTYGMKKDITNKNLAQASNTAISKGLKPYVVVFAKEEALVPTELKNAEHLSTIVYNKLPTTLFTPPRGLVTVDQTIIVSRLDENGNTIDLNKDME